MQQLAFRVTSPAPREIWYDLLKSDSEAMVSQTPAWLDCICATGGYKDVSRLYETTGGRQLILPLVRRTGLPAAMVTDASLPHNWGIGGLVAPMQLQSEDIIAVFGDLSDQLRMQTSVRPRPLSAAKWASAVPNTITRMPHLTHILDLEGGFEQVWTKRFKSATRNKIRKAERSGLVVECDVSGKLVPVFYEIYLRWVDRRADERRLPHPLARWLGRRREPLRKFQLVAHAFRDACRVWVAWFQGEPVAASIELVYGANAMYWRGFSDRQLSGSTWANYLLQHLMIEDACRFGCRYYHMGESGGVASLMHFKTRFGATAYPYWEYYVERLPIARGSEWLGALRRVIEQQLIRRDRIAKLACQEAER